MTWLRALLVNRFALALLGTAAIVGAINLFVVLNDDGLLGGQVVDPRGRPISDAEVTIYKPALIGLEEIERQRTDLQGRFLFRGHGQHHPALQVRTDGYGESELHRIRLYFRNQNRVLQEPITVGAGE
jgi:hypothetical protein